MIDTSFLGHLKIHCEQHNYDLQVGITANRPEIIVKLITNDSGFTATGDFLITRDSDEDQELVLRWLQHIERELNHARRYGKPLPR